MTTDEHAVMVIDNRSTDNTVEAARASADKSGKIPFVIARNVENYGLGGTQKVGINYAIEHGYDFVTILHGDDQGDISDLLVELETRDLERLDALLGARFAPGAQLKGYSAFRTFGNRVFNVLFSAVANKRIFDLGSGLNMYRSSIFQDGFHTKFTDDLTFNYCMVLGHANLRHCIEFFPIQWSEDDQISNVKLVSQTKKVIGILLSYFLNSRRFMESDHRSVPRAEYATEILENTRL